MQSNVFLQFLQEIFSRLKTKSPKFFIVIQWVAGATAAITGIPQFLQSLGVVLPHPFDQVASKVISIASSVALFISMLTVQSTTPPVDPTTTGTSTTPKLPFTNKNTTV